METFANAVKLAILSPGVVLPLPSPMREYCLALALSIIITYPILLIFQIALEKAEEIQANRPRALPAPPAPLFAASEKATRALPATAGATTRTAPQVAVVGSPDALLARLDDEHHVALIGSTGSGKTSLLLALARYYTTQPGAKVIALDPHASPRKWGARVAVVGAGRDYPAIGAMLRELLDTMQQRYSDLGAGRAWEGDFQPIYIFSDEWRSILNHVEDAGALLSELLTEARKANIKLVVACHSRFLSSLGLDDSGIRECLALCHLTGGKNKPFLAEVDNEKYATPPPPPAPPPPPPPRENRISETEISEISDSFTLSEKAETAPHAEISVSENDQGWARKVEAVRAARLAGMGKTAAIKSIWGCSPGGGGRWMEAQRQYNRIIAELT